MKYLTIFSLVIVVALSGLSPRLGQAQNDNHSLTDREMSNLTSFTQLYGYVRFFHPSDETMQADWDQFALDGVVVVLEAESDEELAQILQELFEPIAPTVQVFMAADGEPPIPEILTRRDNYVVWQVHRGFGLGDDFGGQSVYKSFRRSYEFVDVELPEDVPDPANPPIYNLGNGISARVPRSLYVPTYNNVERYHGAKPVVSFEHKADRVGTVIIMWSILEHFFPYWAVTVTAWDAMLATGLTSAAQASDDQSMQAVLQQLTFALHDGHANVWQSDGGQQAPALVPFAITYIEGAYVVSVSELEEVPIGSTVVALNGRLIEDVLAENHQMISASTEQFQRSLDFIFFNIVLPYTETLEVQLQTPNGNMRVVNAPRRLTYTDVNNMMLGLRPEPFAELEDGIYYVDLTRFDNIAYNLNKSELAQAKGIIFDMRGYPSGVPPAILGYLTDTAISSAQFLTPYITEPHFTNVDYTDGAWLIQPNFPRFTDNIVFLTNGSAISYAETLMGIVEYYELGEIVGEPTAGTNGNIVSYALPGGLNFMWTGMLTLKHDGSPHHGVGIQPTVPVTQTIDDLIRGEDTQLKAALEVIQANE